MIIPCSGSRGCGTRTSGGLYACVSRSPTGLPIESFILDPARLWKGEPFRAPILYERQSGFDMLVWIGAEFYPFVPDFIEEARAMGISRRIPRGFPIEKLVPKESRMILIHPKSIPQFEYSVKQDLCQIPELDHTCTFDLWPLSSLESMDKHIVHQLEGVRGITTPSVKYSVHNPLEASEERWYSPGAFAAFHFTHLEFVSLVNKAPKDLAEKVTKVGIELLVLPN